MVRGRRVRAVVTYQNDDCCSPHPKRRDQRTNIKSKLPPNILNTNKGQSITQFFQSVGVAIDYNEPVIVDDLNLENKIDINECILGKSVSRIIDNKICREVNDFIDLNETPIITESKYLEMKSPSTPHRIELCIDNENNEGSVNGNGIIANEQIAPPIQKMPPPKVKRRLKKNPTNGLDGRDSEKSETNHKLTEYFPVRRSVRKTKKTVLEEKQRVLEEILRSKIEDGLIVKEFEGKGRGIVACRTFFKGDFVVEYSGDLIDTNEAKLREQKYAQDQTAGCYMYYFKHKNIQYCIDATSESGRLGRLVNHSRNGNLVTRTVTVDNKPRLVLIAKDKIEMGDEITYDYGDRSKESLKHHPWLAF